MIVRWPERPRCTVFTNTTAGSARAARSANVAGAFTTGTTGERVPAAPEAAAAVRAGPVATASVLAGRGSDQPSQAVRAIDSTSSRHALPAGDGAVVELTSGAARPRFTVPLRPRRSAS